MSAAPDLRSDIEDLARPDAPAAPSAPKGAILTLKHLSERMRVPLSAYVHLTSRCNLPCMHCYQVRDGTRGGLQEGYGPDMDTATIVRTLEDLAAMGTMVLSLTGGEALLRPDFDAIVRHARRLGFVVRLFTNGVLVDEKMADRIAAAAPQEVHVSVYGVTAETHEAVTCAPGSFAKTRRCVELLRARRVPVRIKCQCMTVNFHEWRQVRGWAESLGCEFSLDVTMTAREDGDTFPTTLRLSEEQLADVYRDVAVDQIAKRADSWLRWLDSPHDDREDMLNKSLCGACSTTVAVVADGRVRSCQLMHVDAGNVKEEALPTLWSEAAWFKRVRGVTLGALRECKTCPDLPFCERCTAMALHEGGDELGPSEEHCRQAAVRRQVWESEAAARRPGRSTKPEYETAAQTTTGAPQARAAGLDPMEGTIP